MKGIFDLHRHFETKNDDLYRHFGTKNDDLYRHFETLLLFLQS